MQPGPKNLITDIAGLKIGNASNETLKSGVTALICDHAMTCSVAIHGGAPGTRDVALLEPDKSVSAVDALVLSGGSAFGLDAASGVQSYLRRDNRGFQVGPVRVPIVPAAILFDLINGGDKDWGLHSPYRDLGLSAAESAGKDFALGSQGAGTGALVAGLKGGLGSASSVLSNGITIAALVAVNALGSPLIANTKHFHAAMFEKENEFGGFGLPPKMPDEPDQLNIKFRNQASPVTNTTIGIIAANAKLDKAQCKRLAVAAHDGFARALWPAHTPMDGDLIFGLSSGEKTEKISDTDWIDMSAIAASTMARAVARGIFEAEAHANDLFPAYNLAFTTD